MSTGFDYAPKTPEKVIRTASLHAAKAFGTEGVQINPVAGGEPCHPENETNGWLVWAYEVTNERWPSGCAKLGRDMLLSVDEDGIVTELAA